LTLPVHAGTDPLDRPALMSPRAVRLAQLAVTRAGNRLVSVGERGCILLSDDQGRNWRQVSTPTSVTLTNIAFVGDRYGWAVGHGGVVLATADAGMTWQRQLDGRRAADIELKAAAKAASESSTEAHARRLANAERLVADGPDKPFFAVRFFDEKTGIVVGAYGLAFMTRDGGRNWESIIDRIDDPKGRHLYAVDTDGPRMFLAGEQGALYRSDDQGKTFTALHGPATATFFGVTAGGGELLAFGLRGNAWRSADGGTTWSKVDMAPISLTAGRRLADGSLALVDETGRVLRSTDDGRSFRPIPAERLLPLTGLAQAADGTLVAASASGFFYLNVAGKSMESHQ
jgi:photosystem II stability/assembly factor-like uncharacterized protein